MKPTLMTSSPKPSNDFDPQARFIAEDGLSYANLAAYLKGEADPEDRCNPVIRGLKDQGRSGEFCRHFRKGYEGGTNGQEPWQRGRGSWTYVAGGHAIDYWREHNGRIRKGSIYAAERIAAGPLLRPTP